MRKTTALDCARKLRIHYFLDSPILEIDLKAFPGELVAVNRFSKKLKGAKDHFLVNIPGEFHISGILGEVELTATYDRSAVNFAVRRVESWLSDLERAGEKRSP